MGKAQTVEESIWGRERENVRMAKKERKKVMVEGEGEGKGGVGEGGVRGSKSHVPLVGFLWKDVKLPCSACNIWLLLRKFTGDKSLVLCL